MKIERLKLRKRTEILCKTNGINSVEKVLAMGEKELLQLKNFTRIDVRHINDCVKTFLK